MRFIQSSVIGSSYCSAHAGQEIFSCFFFVFPEHCPTMGPSQSFSCCLIGSSDLFCLVTFHKWIFKWGAPDYLWSASWPPPTDGCFYFWQGKDIIDGQMFAPSVFSTLPCSGKIFLRLFEDVLPSVAFFSIDTDICNSLQVLSGGHSFIFPWCRLMPFD